MRWSRSLRLSARIAATAIVALGAWPSPARGADATHWLTPSHYIVSKDALFASGIPPGNVPASAGDRAELVREGAVLYGVHCSSCHGSNLQGTQGAPWLVQSGGATVDFYLTTGRMPLANRSATDEGSALFGPSPSRSAASGVQAYHVPSLFDARQTAALVAYVDAHAFGITPTPNVRLDSSKLAQGRRIFENNCQACHGAAAQGATAGEGWVALPLDKATPTQIGQAIRIGPGIMPRFTSSQLSDDDVNAVATYVRYLAEEPQTYGGTVMQYLGPISEGAASAFIGVGFLFWVIYFTGTKADGRRVNELDSHS